MSSETRGPAYILSLLAGALLLLGGTFRAVAAGELPSRAFGLGYKIMSRALPNINFGLGTTALQASAIVGIVSGIAVMAGAVMLGPRLERNAILGAMIIIFSATGLIGGGGFVIGSVLGMFAGILAIVGRPVLRSV